MPTHPPTHPHPTYGLMSTLISPLSTLTLPLSTLPSSPTAPLQPTHALAAAIREAERCRETGESKVILTALCGHGFLDMAAYDKFKREWVGGWAGEGGGYTVGGWESRLCGHGFLDMAAHFSWRLASSSASGGLGGPVGVCGGDMEGAGALRCSK